MPDFEYDTTPSIFMTPAGAEIRAWTRQGTQDWNSLYSCITQDEYELNQIFKPDMSLLDVGGHVGGVALLAVTLGASRVVVVEALPENCDVIQRNFELNGWLDKLELINKAIARADGEFVPIFYGDTATANGRVHQFIGHVDAGERDIPITEASTRIISISLNKLLDDWHYFDVMKIDCEGSEWPAFQSATDLTMRDIGAIVAELHPVDDLSQDPTARFLQLFPDWAVRPLASQTPGSNMHMVHAVHATA